MKEDKEKQIKKISDRMMEIENILTGEQDEFLILLDKFVGLYDELKELHKEIEMPTYYWEDEKTKEKHYDYEEMADELGRRIKETLNRNVVVIIEELEEEE